MNLNIRINGKQIRNPVLQAIVLLVGLFIVLGFIFLVSLILIPVVWLLAGIILMLVAISLVILIKDRN